MYDVFISYSRKNIKEAKQIYSVLSEAGLNVFLDVDGIKGAADFTDKIATSITDCRLVLFLVSKDSVSSKYTHKEVVYALDEKKILFPVKLDDVQIEGNLKLLLGDINWKEIGSDFTIDRDLVEEIKYLLDNPDASHAHVVKLNSRKSKSVLIMSIVIVLMAFILLALASIIVPNNIQRREALRNSVEYRSKLIEVDSLLRACDAMQIPGDPESTFANELDNITKAEDLVKEISSLKAPFEGTEYSVFFAGSESLALRRIEGRKDSMFAVWAHRAKDSHEYYLQFNDEFEEILSKESALKALILRPERNEEFVEILK